MYDPEKKYSTIEKEFLSIFDLILEEDVNIYQLGEAHGLYRHWGHPTINEELGCEKIKKIGRNRPMPTQRNVVNEGCHDQIILNIFYLNSSEMAET